MIEQTKKCKQCLKILPISNFEQYPYRGNKVGPDRPETGHKTICRQCDVFNRHISRLWKKPEDKRTEADTVLLDKAAEFYKSIKRMGGDPLGTYARHILNGTVTPCRGADKIESVINNTMQGLQGTKQAQLIVDIDKYIQLGEKTVYTIKNNVVNDLNKYNITSGILVAKHSEFLNILSTLVPVKERATSSFYKSTIKDLDKLFDISWDLEDLESNK